MTCQGYFSVFWMCMQRCQGNQIWNCGGSHLLLQGSHSLLQVQLQSLIGLWQKLVHRVRETLVVFVIHPLPLPRLKEGREKEREKSRKEKDGWWILSIYLTNSEWKICDIDERLCCVISGICKNKTILIHNSIFCSHQLGIRYKKCGCFLQARSQL